VIYRREVPPFDPTGAFGGDTFDPTLDGSRLTKQLDRVFSVLSTGRWYTLDELAKATRAPQASVSARLRDLRKTIHGGWIIERRRRGNLASGLFEYSCSGKKPNDGCLF
jgi:hypothetical protein